MSLKKDISKEDIIAYSSWEIAPIITSNNLDRYWLSSIQSS